MTKLRFMGESSGSESAVTSEDEEEVEEMMPSVANPNPKSPDPPSIEQRLAEMFEVGDSEEEEEEGDEVYEYDESKLLRIEYEDYGSRILSNEIGLVSREAFLKGKREK